VSVTTASIEWPSDQLEAVVALHRADSHRLGFFPRGAFEEHARARQILLAFDERGEAMGYLLYRVAKQRAMITHLCTAPAARGCGVARALVEHLKRVSKPLTGIGLHCRQDYDAKHVWAKFGFRAVHRRAGRGQDGHELTFWWFDHEHPDLFTRATSGDEQRQKVVVDANVFFDLQGREKRDREDSMALLADWVQASIELCVTKELFNEIDRAPDKELREQSKAAVTRYSVLKSDDNRFQIVCDELKSWFPEDAVLRDDSDLRQIAYAVAGDSSYFVTRDEALAQRCEPLYERYGLQVLHPAELISSLDVLERETQYSPARIAGSRLESRALKAADVELVVKAFRDNTQEKANEFRKAVLHCLSKPREVEAKLIVDREQRPILFGVCARTRPDLIDVTMLRSTDHSLAPTMVRNFLRATLEAATREKPCLVVVSDMGAGVSEVEALIEFGFVPIAGKWVKTTMRLLGTFHALRSAANIIPDETLAEASRLAIEAAETSDDPNAAAMLEARFWPAKVTGSVLPTFIVSIRAEWAQHFFDDDLASQFLFGTREELLLGIEGVYYCSAKNRHLTAPARILWYVSKGNDGTGSMSIKACSRLEEVVIGKPKEVFKRFRRLGVFQWKDVFEAAKKDLTNDVLAFRFSMTERFSKPFPLDRLAALDIRHPLLTPRRISDAQFATIYSHGCDLA